MLNFLMFSLLLIYAIEIKKIMFEFYGLSMSIFNRDNMLWSLVFGG